MSSKSYGDCGHVKTIGCGPNVVVYGCMEVRRTFMLDFHVGGLVVSCGCFWCFKGSNLRVGCE